MPHFNNEYEAEDYRDVHEPHDGPCLCNTFEETPGVEDRCRNCGGLGIEPWGDEETVKLPVVRELTVGGQVSVRIGPDGYDIKDSRAEVRALLPELLP
jgi:hypothetical protein